MALLTLSRMSALRPAVSRLAFSPLLRINSQLPAAPMATTAHEQMKEFWKKNIELNRPNSPWTVYAFHLPMATSLCHRITGIAMGIALYGIAIGSFVAPGDFPAYLEFLKSLELAAPIWFTMKMICAFPLVYHYINGIRHLAWDAGKGMKLTTQYKSGSVIVCLAIAISAFLASIAYTK